MDIRDMPQAERENLIPADVRKFLDKLPAQQAEVLKRGMLSEEFTRLQLLVQVDELTSENKRLQGLVTQSERAIPERDKAVARAKAAEDARAAAERVAQKELSARKSAEAEIEELISAVRAASDEQSRLDRLVEKFDR